MNNQRTYQVTCWPESGSDDAPIYRNLEVEARHSQEARSKADQSHEASTKTLLPQERRHMVTPVEDNG